MSLQGLREAVLVRDKSHLRHALAGVYSNTELKRPCIPAPLGPTHSQSTHLPQGTNQPVGYSGINCRTPYFIVSPCNKITDNYDLWSRLDGGLLGQCLFLKDTTHRLSSKEGAPMFNDRPSPAQLSFIYLKLREEVPAFFSGHHSYDMYSPKVEYENHLTSSPWRGHGLRSYQLFLSSSRLALKSVYSKLVMDLIKITKDTECGRVEARWRVRGMPKYTFSRRQRVVLEGFSTFVINSDGLISEHKMSRIMPPRKERWNSFNWLTQLGLWRKVPQPEM